MHLARQLSYDMTARRPGVGCLAQRSVHSIVTSSKTDQPVHLFDAQPFVARMTFRDGFLHP